MHKLLNNRLIIHLKVWGVSVSNIGLLPLKQAIAHAKSDPKIKGIYLDVTYPMAGVLNCGGNPSIDY
jgi:hypothetical protein